MEQQNVTVSLPAGLVRQVRHLAVDRGVSLSRFIALLLQERVEQEEGYRAARERQISLMRAGLALGTEGRTTWTRQELHDH